MKYRESISISAIVLLALLIALFVIAGKVSVNALSIVVIGVLLVGIFGIGWWGFKKHIEENDNAFYSPVHAMIVTINSEFPRETALSTTVGLFVNSKRLRIDDQFISKTFSQNMTKFTDEDLKMWRKIESQINGYLNGGGFWLGRNEQLWFDGLEARFIKR
jgi:hypothetical protein